jgi:hypothetical protein
MTISHTWPLHGRSKERQHVSFAWIRQNQFIFHLQVSWCRCSIVDSYHLKIGIINGDQVLMVRQRMERHRSTHKTLRSMIMGSQSLTWQMWVIKMNLGFSLQLLHKCFTYLIPRTRRNTSLFLENELSKSTIWRMRKNTTNVMRCLSLWIREG